MTRLTEEQIGTSSVGEEAVVVVRDIRHRNYVKLLLAAAPSCVDRYEYRNADETAHKTSNDRHLEKAQEEIGIQRVVIEHV